MALFQIRNKECNQNLTADPGSICQHATLRAKSRHTVGLKYGIAQLQMTYDHVLSKCKGLPELVEDIGRVTYYLRWQLGPQRHRFFNYKQHGGQKDMAADKKSREYFPSILFNIEKLCT